MGHHSQSFHRSPDPGTRSPASFHRSPDPVTRSPASFHRSPVPLAAAERSQPSFHRAAGGVGTPGSGFRSIVGTTARSPSPPTARVSPPQSRAGMAPLQASKSDYILSATSARGAPALAHQQQQLKKPAAPKDQNQNKDKDQKQDHKQLQQQRELPSPQSTIWWPPKEDTGGEQQQQQQQQPQPTASSTKWSPPAGQSTPQLDAPAMTSREPPSRHMRTSTSPPAGGSAGQTRAASPGRVRRVAAPAQDAAAAAGVTQPSLTFRQGPLETSQMQALCTTVRGEQLQQKSTMFWHAPACATAAQPQATQRQHFPSWTPSPVLQGQQATRPAAAPLSWSPAPIPTEASKVSPSNAKISSMACAALLGSASPMGRRFAVS